MISPATYASKGPCNFLDAAERRSWRELAGHSGYDEYIALARTLDVDQAFWLGLFADSSTDGTALVLETRLGTLSARLAPYFRSVISWHATASAADCTRRRLGEQKIDNVRIVVTGKPADLDPGGERFAAIVFYGPGQDLTQQWGGDTASLLNELTEKLPFWLSDGGVLVIGDNNRCTYRHCSPGMISNGHRSGILLPVLRRKIDRLFPCSDLYVCSAPVTSGHSPPPDFIRHEATLSGSTLPKNRIAATKRRILNSRPARLLWPSFLLIASTRPVRGFLQEVLESRQVSDALAWGANDKPVVKRVVAGNSGTSVVIAGPPGRETADVVVRLSSRKGARRPCRVETGVAALKKLARTSLSDRVPRLVHEGIWKDRPYSVETRCSGLEIDPSAGDLGMMLRQSFEVLHALQQETGRLTTISEGDFQESLARYIRELADFCPPDIRERLDRLVEKLRSVMVGCSVYRGYTHGDYKLGNILCDRSRKLTAVIDWDGFSENGFPVFDYLTLLVFSIAYEENKRFAEVYLEYILPWRLPDTCARLAEEILSGLTVDKDSFLFMRVIFWFALLSARFDPLLKYHADWREKFLLPVLPALEDALHLEVR
jgi:aminoglycoside phosphotransferase (APT) family kinase protein